MREEHVKRVSSKVLAERFHLSAPLIRKDLAHFGEFGIRGHGYDVDQLIDRLKSLLGLDRKQPVIVVGMGKLGSAQATFDQVIAAGIRSVLNFAPVRPEDSPSVNVRNVDLRIYLEELAFRSQSGR